VSRGVIWDVKGLASGESRGGGPAPLPLFWVKKEEITEGKKKKNKQGEQNKTALPSPFSSRSGSSTVDCHALIDFFLTTTRLMTTSCDGSHEIA